MVGRTRHLGHRSDKALDELLSHKLATHRKGPRNMAMNVCITVSDFSGVVAAGWGDFTSKGKGGNQRELVVAKKNRLVLYWVDGTGQLREVCSTAVFATIREMCVVKGNCVAVTSDSGCLSLASFDDEKNDWVLETSAEYGQAGCVRHVPGQYLAVSDNMLLSTSLENQRVLFSVDKDNEMTALEFSDEEEAEGGAAVVFCVCAVLSQTQPMFAVLEAYRETKSSPEGDAMDEVGTSSSSSSSSSSSDDDDAGTPLKRVAFYAVRHDSLVRIKTVEVDASANLLSTVPSGTSKGQHAVLVCGDGLVSLVTLTSGGNAHVTDASIPGSGLITSACNRALKSQEAFVLVQTEQSSVYRVHVNAAQKNVKIEHFSTFEIPCATSLSLSPIGLLFVAAETGDHQLVQIDSLGSSSTSLDSIPSLAGMTDFIVEDLEQTSSPQIYAVVKKQLSVLKNGMNVHEAATATLSSENNTLEENQVTGVWPLKAKYGDVNDRYLVISFATSTALFEIGDDGHVSLAAPGQHRLLQYLHRNKRTIECVLLADGAILQVHKTAVVHIPPEGEATQWDAPDLTMIEHACGNAMQMTISLNGGDLRYFQLTDGQLLESGTEPLDKNISCMDMSVAEEELGGLARYLAVGCVDDTVQLLSLQQNAMLAKICIASFGSQPSSVCFSVHGGGQTMLLVGCVNGELTRISVSAGTGSFAIEHQQLLGGKTVRLVRVQSAGRPAVLAVGNKTLLVAGDYADKHGNLVQDDEQNLLLRAGDSVLPMQAPEHACSLASPVFAGKDAFVLLVGNTFKVVTLSGYGQTFSLTSMPLPRTPKKIVRVPGRPLCAVLTSEQQSRKVSGKRPWDSSIELVDPISRKIVHSVHLGDRFGAFSLCTVPTGQQGEGGGEEEEKSLLVVGGAVDANVATRTGSKYALKVFRVLKNTVTLSYEVETEYLPTFICLGAASGTIAVAMGSLLRLYDVSEKTMLRISDFSGFSTASPISKISCMGNRLFVGHATNFLTVLKINQGTNSMELLAADNSQPSFVTALAALSSNTVGGGDIFGNAFITTIPEWIEDGMGEDGNGGGGNGEEASSVVKAATTTSMHGGEESGAKDLLGLVGSESSGKGEVTVRSHYYLGGAVVKMAPVNLGFRTQTVLLASSAHGTFSALFPLRTSEDITFMRQLEESVRQVWEHKQNLCNRSHRSYRSCYEPTKGTIDGDLCLLFTKLDKDDKEDVAKAINDSLGGSTNAMTVKEVDRRIRAVVGAVL